jgi:hypothetical protein
VSAYDTKGQEQTPEAALQVPIPLQSLTLSSLPSETLNEITSEVFVDEKKYGWPLSNNEIQSPILGTFPDDALKVRVWFVSLPDMQMSPFDKDRTPICADLVDENEFKTFTTVLKSAKVEIRRENSPSKEMRSVPLQVFPPVQSHLIVWFVSKNMEPPDKRFA